MFDLPSLLFLGVAGLGLVLLIWLWPRKPRLQPLRERLESFKSAVVSFSDRLDGLQHRHKMLPFLDEDFSKPMAARTLASYESAGRSISDGRERWLKMMDAWEHVEARLKTGSVSSKEEHDLGARLDAVAPESALQNLAAECERRLEQLENGHERAATLRNELGESHSDLRERMAGLAFEGDVLSAFDPGWTDVEELLSAADSVVEADPLGAFETLTEARRLQSALRGDIEHAEILLQRMNDVAARRSAIEEAIAASQRDGLLFAEPEGDPRPLAREAERELRQAALEWRAGRLDLAEPQAAAAEQAMDRAEHVIAFQQKMRSYCQDELGRLREQEAKARDDANAAAAQLDQLRRGFAEESWLLVADAPEQAVAMLDGLDGLLQRIEDCIGPGRQHYFRANRLLEEARQCLSDAEGLVAAAPSRLRELSDVRDECRKQLAELRRTLQTVAESLRATTADRPRSQHRAQQAQRRLEEMLAESSATRVDWPRLARHADQLASDVAIAQSMIREDVDLADQARRELDEAARVVRWATSFYRNGVRPSLDQSQRILQDAERLVRDQRYEEAIAAAASASRAATAAREQAESDADVRQREINRRNRAQMAARVTSVLEIAAATAIRAIQHRSRRRRW